MLKECFYSRGTFLNMCPFFVVRFVYFFSVRGIYSLIAVSLLLDSESCCSCCVNHLSVT